MTETTGRLLDLWLPPEGAGRPIGCLATTFTFEPDFFEEQCVGRFLGLQTKAGEGDRFDDIAAIIEREERLAEVPVSVIADRRLNPDSRSLRWDLLAARAPTGVMHAKVSLLHWERLIRVIVSSANLSESSYRSAIEIATALDAEPDGDLPAPLAISLIEAVSSIVDLAPRDRRPEGPRTRAAAIAERARQAVDDFSLPAKPRRGDPQFTVVVPNRHRDAIDGLMEVWRGSGPPLHASVMSPFFDTGGGASRAAARLVGALSKRGASASFVIPVEQIDDTTYARAPAALRGGAMPARIATRLVDVRQPDPDEPRRLHAKVILLERADWVAALIGSSNFTAAGLWAGGRGNVEAGLAIGVPGGSAEAAALQALVLAGAPIDESSVEFEPIGDPEETEPEMPTGFVQALLHPGTPPSLELQLEAKHLPDEWRAKLSSGQELISSAEWAERGSPEIVDLPLDDHELPQHIAVEWTADGQRLVMHMAVNVETPSALPPPEELRALPLASLIQALSSMRPLPEAVAIELRRAHAAESSGAGVELDPHKRFSPNGQLLYRTRGLSRALDAQRERLQRPLITIDAFHWRVNGPFGPVALAKRLADERAGEALPGELAFIVAETALTLRSVDLAAATARRPELRAGASACIAAAIEELQQTLAMVVGQAPPGVNDYVAIAFERAGA